MSNSGLAVVPTNAMADWDLIRRQAEVLVKSGMLPGSVKTPEAAVAIMVLGRELGFKPMQSFRMIDVIQGRPTVNAAGMAGMVQDFCRQHGGYLRAVETTPEQVTVEFKRAEWPSPHRLTFSLEDAKRANLLGKDTWKQYPQQMCYARAVSAAARMGWPEVVGGIYDPEELGGTYQPTVTVQDDAPFDEMSRAALPERAEVIDQETGEILDAPAGPSKAMARLHAIGAERGLDHDDIHQVMRLLAPQFQSLGDATEAALSHLANQIETAGEIELAAWQTDWEAEIAASPSVEALTNVGTAMRDAGITRETHRQLQRP